jgi:gamma-glutamylcysteine synthetase
MIGVAGAAQVATANASYANRTLQQAETVLAQVNESGYLVFYPNLTKAYADLSKAQQLYNTSPQGSLFYSQRAISEAEAQYQSMSSYRLYSALVMGAATLVFIFLLLRLFTPAKGRRAGAKPRG